MYFLTPMEDETKFSSTKRLLRAALFRLGLSLESENQG